MSANSALSVKSAEPMVREPPPLGLEPVAPAVVVGEPLLPLLEQAANVAVIATGRTMAPTAVLKLRIMVLLVVVERVWLRAAWREPSNSWPYGPGGRSGPA